MMPREHGSWAVLIAPLLVGWAAAQGAAPMPAVLFCLAAFGIFMLRPALQSCLSGPPASGTFFRAALFAGLATIGAVPLLLIYRRWWLLAFAVPAASVMALNIHLSRARRSSSWPNEVAGILALCLGAPAVFYAAGGFLSSAAWLAWVLCVLYFIGPVFFVKLAVLQHRAAAGAVAARVLESMRRDALAYHTGVLAAVIAASGAGWVTPLAPLPFAAAFFKTWRRARQGPGKVNFRRLGYQEIGYACFFAAVLVAGQLF